MKCPKCGTEYGAGGCPACGWGSAPRLVLKGAGGEISTSVDLDFGKALGARVVGPDAKYMDDVQFTLRSKDEKWYAKPYPRTRNPLYVNGEPAEGEFELADGDRLSLKGKAGFMDVTVA